MKSDFPKLVVWDFNGVLLDDAPVEASVINRMLERRGLARFRTVDDYRNAFSFPVADFYRRVGIEGDLDAVSTERGALYAELSRDARARDGAREALRELGANGVVQVLLSATEERVLSGQVASLGLEDAFDEVVGASGLGGRGKERLAAELLGRYPGYEAVVVGDTVRDFEIARSVGARCVLVEGGHEDACRLRRCGCPVAGDVPGLLREVMEMMVL